MTSEDSFPPSYLSVHGLRLERSRREGGNESGSISLPPITSPSTHLPPLPDPIALTWTPEPEVPFGNPPGYTVSRNPTTAVIYSFSRLSSNAMLLIPPANFPDSRPRYHISVNLNCFMPSSFIITVHRGATENDEFVGDFEMGICDKPGTVFLRGKETLISQVLEKISGSRKTGHWIWRCPGKTKILSWTWPSLRAGICKTSTVQVARFTPASTLRRSGNPVDLSQLEVFPAGQEHFDDILMSALIIERKRLTPGRAKEMFN